MKKIDLIKFYKQHNLDKDDVYKDDRGFIIIKRSGIEKIQYQNNIKVAFETIKCELDNVVFKAVSMRYDSNMQEFIPLIETFGSASKNNCRNHFLAEMAEKRALSRVIIKTMQFTNVKGEDEIKNQPSKSLNSFK